MFAYKGQEQQNEVQLPWLSVLPISYSHSYSILWLYSGFEMKDFELIPS